MRDNLLKFTDSFNDIKSEVTAIADTENSYEVRNATGRLNRAANYSPYGLVNMGRLVKFPPDFIKTLTDSDETLSELVIENRINNYCKNGRSFTVREYNGKICGAVTDKYAFFDDKEVIDIVENSRLSEMKYQAQVSPERLHIRAIDDEEFYIPNDKSPLRFMYYIDNSNVGRSSFKINLGIYRQVCTNGMIVSQKDFVICKHVHKGTKGFSTDVDMTLKAMDDRKETIKMLVINSALKDSSISKIKEDYRLEYLSKKLNLPKKETGKVIKLFNETYDGKTKWGLTNAITEYARDLSDIDKREYLERQAFIVA